MRLLVRKVRLQFLLELCKQHTTQLVVIEQFAGLRVGRRIGQ